ncbi:WXG100 family type VII secretion target [Nocardia sp. CA2R105]|uniref:WXG100 family type VII secretion target n=1 Tax=Nocardia coffeae TaxID=2873381 RepID=UPI001CA77F35|nr:WXG100 family type VII secretion target [Nocardia coffeae]MBY8860819.1 WXG100 family type VII secretion target [Nocardia coffeae]
MTAQNELPQIPNKGENVLAWSRQDIQDAFEHLDTSDAQAQALKYATAASDWDQGLETFKRSVGASISEAWEGASAEAAKKAITEYTTDAANLTDLLSGIGKDISAAANAVVQTKSGIKPAAEHSWTTNIPYFGRAQARSEEHTRTQNEADTRDAMLQHYVTEFRRTDSSVPVLPASLNPTKKDDSAPKVTGPGTTNPTTSSGPNSTDSSDKNSNDKNSKDSTDSSDQSKDQNQSTNPSSNTDGSSQSNDKNDSTSTSPSSTDSSATTPSSVSPSSYNASGTGGYGGAGGDTDGTSGGGAGRSVPGTSSPNASQTAAAAASTRAGASTSGLGGMGGMGGAGKGKGEQDEDRTHTTPDYLINAENAEELIGELTRTIPGGVIGGDFDGNKTSQPPPA